MSRSLYPTIFCSTLVLLGAILLRPGTAQDLLNLANQVRGQAPDSTVKQGYNPGIDPRVRSQFDSIPQAPTQPMPLRYPTNQDKGPGPAGPGANYPAAPAGAPEGIAPAQRLDSALIIARVGSDAILASDLLGHYAAYAAAQAEGAPETALAEARKELLEEIRNLADSKTLFAEATKTIPAEALKDIERKINEEFEKTQVKEMMQRTKCNTKEDLDAKLREAGTSLERRRKYFFESNVAKGWLSQQVKDKDQEVAHGEIIAYYQSNATKFDHQAQARWEQLTARFDHFSSEAEAERAIEQMGDDVLRGVPFAEVAKAHSQGPTADNGGQRDWTTKGSLKSDILNEAIFGLPVMSMSQKLKDAEGFHIVRVIERKEAYRTPFLEAQVEIRNKLRDEQLKKKSDAYLAKLRLQNPIWTIFDGQASVAGAEAPSRK